MVKRTDTPKAEAGCKPMEYLAGITEQGACPVGELAGL